MGEGLNLAVSTLKDIQGIQIQGGGVWDVVFQKLLLGGL